MRFITFLFLFLFFALFASATDLQIDNNGIRLTQTYDMNRSPILAADTTYIYYDVGGSANFTLNAGVEYAYHEYLVLGGVSGTSPGIPLHGGTTLPLNWDVFTDFVLAYLNSPIFVNFHGFLDGQGNGTAQFNLPASPANPYATATLWFAYCVKDEPAWGSSNSVEIDVGPEWRHPIGYNDPDDAWTYEYMAYDNDMFSACHCPFTWYVPQWSPWLELNLEKPFLCDEISYKAWYSLLYCSMIAVQVYHDGTWIPVHSGGFSNLEVDVHSIPGGPVTVSKARVRFYGHRSVSQPVEADLYDFKFHMVH